MVEPNIALVKQFLRDVNAHDEVSIIRALHGMFSDEPYINIFNIYEEIKEEVLNG